MLLLFRKAFRTSCTQETAASGFEVLRDPRAAHQLERDVNAEGEGSARNLKPNDGSSPMVFDGQRGAAPPGSAAAITLATKGAPGSIGDGPRSPSKLRRPISQRLSGGRSQSIKRNLSKRLKRSYSSLKGKKAGHPPDPMPTRARRTKQRTLELDNSSPDEAESEDMPQPTCVARNETGVAADRSDTDRLRSLYVGCGSSPFSLQPLCENDAASRLSLDCSELSIPHTGSGGQLAAAREEANGKATRGSEDASAADVERPDHALGRKEPRQQHQAITSQMQNKPSPRHLALERLVGPGASALSSDPSRSGQRSALHTLEVPSTSIPLRQRMASNATIESLVSIGPDFNGRLESARVAKSRHPSEASFAFPKPSMPVPYVLNGSTWGADAWQQGKLDLQKKESQRRTQSQIPRTIAISLKRLSYGSSGASHGETEHTLSPRDNVSSQAPHDLQGRSSLDVSPRASRAAETVSRDTRRQQIEATSADAVRARGFELAAGLRRPSTAPAAQERKSTFPGAVETKKLAAATDKPRLQPLRIHSLGTAGSRPGPASDFQAPPLPLSGLQFGYLDHWGRFHPVFQPFVPPSALQEAESPISSAGMPGSTDSPSRYSVHSDSHISQLRKLRTIETVPRAHHDSHSRGSSGPATVIPTHPQRLNADGPEMLNVRPHGTVAVIQQSIRPMQHAYPANATRTRPRTAQPFTRPRSGLVLDSLGLNLHGNTHSRHSVPMQNSHTMLQTLLLAESKHESGDQSNQSSVSSASTIGLSGSMSLSVSPPPSPISSAAESVPCFASPIAIK